MSKARLVITAVTVEKRPVSEVAKSYGVARSWVYTLLARYQAEGEAAFEPRSRRPKTSPSAISDDAADLDGGLLRFGRADGDHLVTVQPGRDGAGTPAARRRACGVGRSGRRA
ncbi:MAG: helix-turn-helix domain-containing protein [Trebonia sp.]